MSTVTHYNQPAIYKTNGHVYDGYKAPYTITKVLWSADVERWLSRRIAPPCLHVCCGLSMLGDVRYDLYQENVTVRGDANRLPFAAKAFETILIDPPYNGVFQWNHDMLTELSRVSRHRIIFQHWFIPADKHGRYKKDHQFVMSDISAFQPQTYFGRANIISVFDALPTLI